MDKILVMLQFTFSTIKREKNRLMKIKKKQKFATNMQKHCVPNVTK